MNIMVDSNILLSIFSEDSLFEKSKALLLKYKSETYLVNGFIFTELRYYFKADIELLKKLKQLDIDYIRDYVPNGNFVIPAWKEYLKNRRYFCATCGQETTPICTECGASLSFRQRILSDFFIGDFVMQNGGNLLTHDAGFYRSYFSGIHILE